jgi:hypothetical protein
MMIRQCGAALVVAATAGICLNLASAQGLKPPGMQSQAPAQQGQPQGQDLGPVVGDGKIVVRARQMRVGQKMAVSFQDFPETGEGDLVQVVAAGAPDNVQPNSSGEKPLSFNYLGKWQVENGWEIGPFAPGLYEVRWLTTLYNNERKLEVGARSQFSVTR